MSSMVKHNEGIVLIEYIPTVADLQYIFSNIQDPSKVPSNTIKCAVQAVAKVEHITGAGLIVRGQDSKTITYITLHKFRDGNKDIWLYEGKVKA